MMDFNDEVMSIDFSDPLGPGQYHLAVAGGCAAIYHRGA